MRIQHPAFPEIVKDVTAYAAWRDAGWVVLDKDAEKPSKSTDAESASK